MKSGPVVWLPKPAPQNLSRSFAGCEVSNGFHTRCRLADRIVKVRRKCRLATDQRGVDILESVLSDCLSF